MCLGGIGIKSILSMQLTHHKLKEWGARCEGLKWFEKTFPVGCSLLVAIARCDNINWIEWVVKEAEREMWGDKRYE